MRGRVYTVPARDVVVGMYDSTQDGKYRQLVISIERDADGVSMRGHGWLRCCPLDSTTHVSLPGPSPRELLCTCASHLPWAPNPGDPPTDHWSRERWPECSDPCPVAPNLDPERGPVHGGLRLWPVGGTWVGGTWAVRRRLGVIGGGAAWLDTYRTKSPTLRDMVLEAFFLPPIVPDLPTAIEQRPTPWDPEDVYEVLG